MKGQYSTDALIPWSTSQSLRRIRRTLGWTQAQLATNTGLNVDTIYEIEHGITRGRRIHVQEIITDFITRHSHILDN